MITLDKNFDEIMSLLGIKISSIRAPIIREKLKLIKNPNSQYINLLNNLAEIMAGNVSALNQDVLAFILSAPQSIIENFVSQLNETVFEQVQSQLPMLQDALSTMQSPILASQISQGIDNFRGASKKKNLTPPKTITFTNFNDFRDNPLESLAGAQVESLQRVLYTIPDFKDLLPLIYLFSSRKITTFNQGPAIQQTELEYILQLSSANDISRRNILFKSALPSSNLFKNQFAQLKPDFNYEHNSTVTFPLYNKELFIIGLLTMNLNEKMAVLNRQDMTSLIYLLGALKTNSLYQQLDAPRYELLQSEISQALADNLHEMHNKAYTLDESMLLLRGLTAKETANFFRYQVADMPAEYQSSTEHLIRPNILYVKISDEHVEFKFLDINKHLVRYKMTQERVDNLLVQADEKGGYDWPPSLARLEACQTTIFKFIATKSKQTDLNLMPLRHEAALEHIINLMQQSILDSNQARFNPQDCVIFILDNIVLLPEEEKKWIIEKTKLSQFIKKYFSDSSMLHNRPFLKKFSPVEQELIMSLALELLQPPTPHASSSPQTGNNSEQPKASSSRLTPEQKNKARKEILETILESVKYESEVTAISLREAGETKLSYFFTEPDSFASKPMLADNNERLPIYRRQEKLGIAGAYFNSLQDYDTFIEQIKNAVEAISSEHTASSTFQSYEATSSSEQASSSRLTPEQKNAARKMIIEKILQSIKKDSITTRISLKESGQNTLSYFFIEPDSFASKPMMADNNEPLPIRKRQERLGLDGAYFNSQSDYDVFVEQIKSTVESMVSEHGASNTFRSSGASSSQPGSSEQPTASSSNVPLITSKSLLEVFKNILKGYVTLGEQIPNNPICSHWQKVKFFLNEDYPTHEALLESVALLSSKTPNDLLNAYIPLMREHVKQLSIKTPTPPHFQFFPSPPLPHGEHLLKTLKVSGADKIQAAYIVADRAVPSIKITFANAADAQLFSSSVKQLTTSYLKSMSTNHLLPPVPPIILTPKNEVIFGLLTTQALLYSLGKQKSDYEYILQNLPQESPDNKNYAP